MLEPVKVTQEPTPSFIDEVLHAAKKAFIFVGVFSFFVNLLMLIVPLYMLQVFDRVFASYSIDTLLYLTTIALTGLAVLALLDATRSRVLVKISQWMDNKLSPEALFRGPDELLQGNFYPQQALKDITHFRQFIGGSPILVLLDAPWVPIYLFVIYLLHPIIGVISTVGAIALFTLAVVNELRTRGPLTLANGYSMQNAYQVNLSLRNAETIQAMGMMPNILKRWFVDNEKVLNLQATANRRSGAILAASKGLRLALQILVLGAGAYFVVGNEFTPGAMIAGTIILSRALAPVEQAIGAWSHMKGAKEAFDRLRGYFSHPTFRPSMIALPKPKGEIVFKDVSYTPVGASHPIVDRVSIKITPGETLVVIGPSAAGKTTIARLLVGSWQPTKGTVRLDGADTYIWDRMDFGRHVGYLPQTIELFPGNVRENISRLGEAADEKVIEAAQKAGVHELILKLSGGYETGMPDAGRRLSGGQRQRLGLARALFGDPQVLVLDEPNASLDVHGENALIHTLQEEKKRGTTIVLITHKMNIIALANKVLLMRDGKAELFGPRDEVLSHLQEIQPIRNLPPKG